MRCTCHPNDRPPLCQRRYAASECQARWKRDRWWLTGWLTGIAALTIIMFLSK